MKDMEQSMSDISSPQLKDQKMDAPSPHSVSKQEKYSCSKQETTLSASPLNGKQQVADVEQSEVESPDLQPEAQRDMPVQSGNPRLQGMASASSQIPFQLPVENSSHAQKSAFIRSFQPYNPLPKEAMYFGQGLNLPSPRDHHFDSRFANSNGIPQLHVQNDVRNSNPRVAVKITHPETKEEIKLDELGKGKKDSSSSGSRAYLNVQLQPHPVAYGHYNSMYYFPYMRPDPFTMQNQASEAFSRKPKFSTSTQQSHSHLGEFGSDMHSATVGSNSVQVSSASIPSKTDNGYDGEKVSSPVSVKPVVNDNNQAIISRRPLRVGSNQGKSKIQPEIVIKPPAISVVSAASAEGVVAGKSVSDGRRSRAMGHSNFIKKDSRNLENQDTIDAHQLKQDEKQSASVSRSPRNLERSTSGSAKLDGMNSQAPSSLELSAGPSLEIQPQEGVDAASKLKNTNNLEHISRKDESHQNLRNAATDSIGMAGKKRYSRNFLLTFSSQFVELPTDFKLVDDNVKGLILGAEAPDDHGYKIQDGSKWNKTPASSASKLEQQFGIVRENFSRGGNFARNLHGQTSDHSDGRNTGLLPQSTFQGGKNKGPNTDQWQRHVVTYRGILPLPQFPLQVMHKAEKKYEVHKVIDDEDAKQRQLKSILNKLTPQNFDRLFQQVKEVNIDNTVTLSGLISQIFDKALMEPTFCEMYASFCYHLASVLPNFVEGHQKITFKRLLLDKCQEEFVRGEREEAETSRIEENGETRLSKEKREEKRIRARRRMLGNIRLIGELYKKRMLTERVLRDCINKLLGDYHNPEEEDIEALCKLMSTVGEIIDHHKAKDQMDAYFEAMKSLSKNAQLSSRIRFMLTDVIDLRNNKWNHRRKVEGPKKIEELHSDAAQERQALVNQLTLGPNFTSLDRRGPANSGPRSSAFQPSQNSRPGGAHTMPPQSRGFPSQYVRLQDKHHKQESVSGDGKNAMMVRNQDGLSRKMSTKRHTVPPNGYNSTSERRQHNIKRQACN